MVGPRKVRARLLQRIDRTNLVESWLGVVSDGHDSARVVLDRVRDASLDLLWPLLDPGRRDPPARALLREVRAALPTEIVETLTDTAAVRATALRVAGEINARRRCGSPLTMPRVPWRGFGPEGCRVLLDAAVPPGSEPVPAGHHPRGARARRGHRDARGHAPPRGRALGAGGSPRAQRGGARGPSRRGPRRGRASVSRMLSDRMSPAARSELPRLPREPRGPRSPGTPRCDRSATRASTPPTPPRGARRATPSEATLRGAADPTSATAPSRRCARATTSSRRSPSTGASPARCGACPSVRRGPTQARRARRTRDATLARSPSDARNDCAARDLRRDDAPRHHAIDAPRRGATTRGG